jgi:hypothetical protein
MTTNRKTRSDKGLIMATDRDLQCLTWISEMYAARFDHIQQLLSRWPGAPMKDQLSGLIAETTVKDQISRWKRAGWIEYRRVLADGRGWAWVTRKGLGMIGLNEIYTAREPASTRLNHLYAVNVLRLAVDRKGTYEWTSERFYRTTMERDKKGRISGPIPDAVIESEQTGPIALEVELSPKKPYDVQDKLVHLVRATYYNHEPPYGLTYKFAFIWFYVPSQRMKNLIESARESLTDDEQARVRVSVEPSLIASWQKERAEPS